MKYRWNRFESEALPSRVQSHRGKRDCALHPDSTGNTTRYCNAGSASSDDSWIRPKNFSRTYSSSGHHRTVGTSSYILNPEIFRNWRSTLDLTDVYNLLPVRMVEQKNVTTMQHELQCLLKFRVVNRKMVGSTSFELVSLCLKIRYVISPDSVATSSHLLSAAAFWSLVKELV